MLRLPDHVETDRLTIRRWLQPGAPAMAAAAVTVTVTVTASVEHLRPWMPWVAHEPQATQDREKLIGSWQVDWELGGDAVHGIFTADGEVAGGCGLHHRSEPTTLDIGYWVHVDHVRQGIATEVAAALTGAAFTLPSIDQIRICHDRVNIASGRVPTKLSFTRGPDRDRTAEAPGESGVEWSWHMTRNDWPATTHLNQ